MKKPSRPIKAWGIYFATLLVVALIHSCAVESDQAAEASSPALRT